MLDRRLRPRAQAALAPIAARCGRIRPSTLTLVGGVPAVAAAVAAAVGFALAAVALWLANRVVDGLDGVVARTTGRTSDAGAAAGARGRGVVQSIVHRGCLRARLPDRLADWLADQQPGRA